jgi:hypothetical protein
MTFGGVARPRLRGLKNKSPPLSGRQFRVNILGATAGGVKSLEKPLNPSPARSFTRGAQGRFQKLFMGKLC